MKYTTTRTEEKRVVEEGFLAFLRTITPTPTFMGMVQEEVRLAWRERDLAEERIDAEAEARVKDLTARRERIFSAFEQGHYTAGEFASRKAEVEAEISAATMVASPKQPSTLDINGALGEIANAITNLPEVFNKLSAAEWARFQHVVIPDGICFDRERGFGTPKLGPIYAISEAYRASGSPMVYLYRAIRTYFIANS